MHQRLPHAHSAAWAAASGSLSPSIHSAAPLIKGHAGNNLANSPTFGSSDAPFINYNTTIDLTDGLTKVWRNHIIKAGFYMQRSRKDQTSFGAFNGSYASWLRPSYRYGQVPDAQSHGIGFRCVYNTTSSSSPKP